MSWPLYLGIGLLVVITIVIITIVARNVNKVATPSTVKKEQRDRIAILNALIEPIAGKKKSLYEISRGVSDDQQLLLNYNVATCRLAGYLGPLQDGVFAEEDAVRLAYAAGARGFVLEISHGDDGRPALVARDSSGFKRSLNNGSLSKVFTAIANSGVRGSDPVIIILYFHDAPRDAEAYLSFLSQVAVAMEPIIPYHLGLTDSGDFTRQKKANELFTFAPDFYKGKILVLTNTDTHGFRDPKGSRRFSPKEDLDFFIHCRVNSLVSGFGISESAGSGTAAAAVLGDDAYFLTTPPDKVASVVNMTRNTFSIVMRKDPAWKGDPTLTKTFGIQCIPVDLETIAAASDSWSIKDAPLRFTKPKPIIPTVPNPQLDARGGNLKAPSL
jgi:hypothetical protein